MPLDMTVELIGATVELTAPRADHLNTVAAGFLVSDPAPDGTPRVVLVTANHVLELMKEDEATVGWRAQSADGGWRYTPAKIIIRDHGAPLWVRHPTRDIAAIPINPPPEFVKAALPLSLLPDAAASDAPIAPGEEMMTLGFPEGLSANSAGFPILRSGKVASYPITPSAAYPTFLLDFHVFPGNSGGPVYTQPSNATPGRVTGVLTQEVEQDGQNLGIGIVTQARYVRETLDLLDHGARPAPNETAEGGAEAMSQEAPRPLSASSPRNSPVKGAAPAPLPRRAGPSLRF